MVGLAMEAALKSGAQQILMASQLAGTMEVMSGSMAKPPQSSATKTTHLSAK